MKTSAFALGALSGALVLTWTAVCFGRESAGEEEPPPAAEKKEEPAAETPVKKTKESVELGEIVVTATRRAIPLEDAPASVTVVDREKLARSPAKTADDVLRSVAGIDNWGNRACDQANRQVTLRGVGAQGRTLILVDGIPVNDAWDGWVEWSQMPKENIERIEVVRGPASSLYGSSAMGGVINIITRPPPEKPIEVRTKESCGTHDTWSSFLSAAGRVERFGYFLSGEHAATDGYKAYPDPQPFETRNDYEEDNLAGKLFWFPDDESSLVLGASRFRSERGRGRKYSNVDPREIDRLSLTYRRDASEGVDWLASVYWHNEDQRIEFDAPPTYSYLNLVEKFHKPFYGGVVQSGITLADWNTLTAGAEYRHSEVEKEDEYRTSPRRAEHRGKQRYFALYLQDEMSFLDDKLLVTLGAREDWWKSYDGSSWDTDPAPSPPFDYDYDSDSWDSFNPRLGAVYHLADATALRASVGTAFRAPSPARQYANLTRGPRLILGNPDLDPEKTLSYEVGVDHYFTDSLLARLTLYQSDGEDFIGSKLKTPPFTYQFDNITEVRMRGVEVGVDYKFGEWSCFANYTCNESVVEDDESDPELEGNDLPHTPRNKLNLGLTYDNPKLFTAGATVRFVDDLYDDAENAVELEDYWTTDLKLSRRIGENAELSLGCENVFNKHYEIPSFDIYEAPGRMWTFSLAVTF